MSIEIKRHYQIIFGKKKDKPEVYLRFRIRYNQIDLYWSIGHKVEENKWSRETQRCLKNTTHGKEKIKAKVINDTINLYEQVSDSIFRSFELKGKYPTKEELKLAMDSKLGKKKSSQKKTNKDAPLDIWNVWDLFTKNKGTNNAWTKSTYKKWSSLKTHLYTYNQHFRLNQLKEDDLIGFTQYLYKIGLRNTTVDRYVKYFRWFLKWANEKGHYTGKLHLTYRPKIKGVDGKSKEVIHLSWEQLLNLYHFEFPKEKDNLERVRDIFCFCCFTSLRYSDVKKLSRHDLYENHIKVVTQKTFDHLTIELNTYSKAILDKYKYMANLEFTQLALPVISNSKMNKYLKVMGKYVGLSHPQRIVYFKGNERIEEIHPLYELLTTHCGRRTFIVSSLHLGIPSEVVMKWTGHSDYDSMKPYIAIRDDLKKREMDKFNPH